MKLLKVGAACLNQTPLDWKHNFQNIVGAIQEAKKQDIRILCLPELCITGYGLEDMFHSLYVYENTVKALFEIAEHTKEMVVSVGLPVMHNGALYNCACLIVDGNIAGFVPKQFLAGDGVHYENRWFKPWQKGLKEQISLRGNAYPIGDIHFKVFDIKIGFEICEDAWVPNRPGADLARLGVDIIMNPSASHFAFGKHSERRVIVKDASRSFKTTYIYANLLGNEAGRCIYSGDTIIASCGKELAVGPLFSYKDRVITSCVVDTSAVKTNRIRSASLEPDFKNYIYLRCKKSIFVDDPTIGPTESIADTELSKNEEFSKAMSLGLFDYLRKSKSNGFVVSLSGGADSSAIAVLVWLMARDILKELGLSGLQDKLPYISLNDVANARDLTNRILSCAYQSTENSSNTTFRAAKELAGFIGAEFYHFEVDELFKSYTKIISNALDRVLTWQTDDIALQNIQARVRAPSVWMLANIKNSLLLATSNRSEAAVGYATMDGDTAGSLSPIAGIDKTFLRQWLKYMERFVLPLELVNNQEPTAELRPNTVDQQTDEKDLMPYDILNKIELLAVKEKKSPLEIFQLFQAENKFSKQKYGEWIEKFFRLFARNAWKRERYAPSFHLDEESLDPKSWLRFPILSGGFKQEIAEMWRYINGGEG